MMHSALIDDLLIIKLYLIYHTAVFLAMNSFHIRFVQLKKKKSLFLIIFFDVKISPKKNKSTSLPREYINIVVDIHDMLNLISMCQLMI
jgi:hypothetical protein